MFSTKSKSPPTAPGGAAPPRPRGRPPGRTPRGDATRRRLYEAAVALIRERGYEAATLREVAQRAAVSVGLLYRYFPSKHSIVLALYDELSSRYAERTSRLPAGSWRDRFVFALKTSLRVLAPHRPTLAALAPSLLGNAREGVFAGTTAFSRRRVQRVFHDAVTGATDAPPPRIAAALARLLYLAHLGVILWWLLDKAPKQKTTTGLVALLGHSMTPFSLALELSTVQQILLRGDALFTAGLFGDPF